MKWLKTNQIQIDVPKHPKKITGTRFASILGKNVWNTPFQIWCEITKTFEKPFEDTKFTIAGKTIEPKQADYMKQKYFMDGLVTPINRYGKDYFNKTRGDFFSDNEMFGGMWDYLNYEDGELESVLEMKTTSRPQDWEKDIPEYYALQGALYGYLLGCDNVVMVASFLEDSDYDHPEDFVVSASNTKVIPFRISERYPNFVKDYIEPAVEWWMTYVAQGISPKFDEKKDADYLKALRTKSITPDESLEELLTEAENCLKAVQANDMAMKPITDRLTVIKEKIKEICIKSMKDGDTCSKVRSSGVEWTVTKSSTSSVDKKKMEKDAILSKYLTTSDTYKLTNKIIKKEA